MLKRRLCGDDSVEIDRIFQDSDCAVNRRRQSGKVHNPEVQARVAQAENTQGIDQRQSPYSKRTRLQQQVLNLPLFPTTTIGSFPQTRDIRRCRMQFWQGELSEGGYIDAMETENSFHH